MLLSVRATMAYDHLWKFPLVLAIILLRIHNAELISHQSNLCQARDLQCGMQDCLMSYYVVNSTRCRDLAFNQLSTSEKNSLGKVKVSAYYYTLSTHHQTGFNVTFEDIHWNNLKFRFKQDGNELKNTCREFHLTDNATTAYLYYDCIWSLQTYEGKLFYFEYEASNASASVYEKFAFRVPIARRINPGVTNVTDWELFTYVSAVASSLGSTHFTVQWQPLPDAYGVNKYTVVVVSNDTGSVEVLEQTNISCSATEPKSCMIEFDKWYGSVQFKIQPVCPEGLDCAFTSTQFFLLGTESAKPMLICIVSATVTVPILLYVLFLTRNYVVRKSAQWTKSKPRVLFIYSASLSCHVDVVFALAKYLKSHCGVEPLLGEWDIPLTKWRDPFKWCNESMRSADLIMVLASPNTHSRPSPHVLQDSVYHNLDALLLRLLSERLAMQQTKVRVFTLLLPYTSQDDVPIEASNLQTFSFPEDLDRLLIYMHHGWHLPRCLSPPVKGGQDDLDVLGKEVRCCIDAAVADLNKTETELRSRSAECEPEKQVKLPLPEEHSSKQCCESGSQTPPPPRGKAVLLELAKVTFSDYPGPLDNLGLSGVKDEEWQSLVGSDEPSRSSGNLFDLDELTL